MQSHSDFDEVWAQSVIERLAAEGDAHNLFSILHDAIQKIGFSDLSYLAGFATEAGGGQLGLNVHRMMHYSTCPGDWLEALFAEHGPENDYDIQRFLLGHQAPFVSGHNILGLMEPLDDTQRRILALKAEAGFAANYIIPLPTAPFARTCFSSMMLISDMDEGAFSRTVTRWNGWILAMVNLVHQKLGGDAHSYLEREANVETCLRRLAGPAAEPVERILSPRQTEVLELMANGQRAAQIADTLGLSRVTVDRHLHAARDALEAKTLVEAAARAMRLGLIRPS